MHTKGPLTAEYSNIYRVTKSEDGDTWALVADCLSGIHTSYKEAKANAVLFAAAPELLEALEDFVLCHAEGGFVEPDADVIEAGKEAIRRAKGE